MTESDKIMANDSNIADKLAAASAAVRDGLAQETDLSTASYAIFSLERDSGEVVVMGLTGENAEEVLANVDDAMAEDCVAMFFEEVSSDVAAANEKMYPAV